MSLILNQPSKLCLRAPVLVRCSPLHSNSLSSASLQQTQTLAKFIYCTDPCRPQLVRLMVRRDDGDMIPFDFDSPCDFMAVTELIRSTNGWITSLVDGRVCLYTHRGKSPDHERIWLPPLETLPLCQAQVVTNVTYSWKYVVSKFHDFKMVDSKPIMDQVEALQLICHEIAAEGIPIFRLLHIRISNPCFFSSPVMYSEKEDMFRIVGSGGSGGHLVGSWDLRKHKYTPKVQRLQFQNLPELSKAKRELLYSCNTSEHLVESRTTGETFMVKWYKRTSKTIHGIERMETKALMVFKIDEEGNAVYTQDIGDLCIILTMTESFCVPACSVRHMRPNRVKIMDVDEITIVDLAAQKWN
ncbi:unnamed protein product [Brassica oleracea var. botrytis]